MLPPIHKHWMAIARALAVPVLLVALVILVLDVAVGSVAGANAALSSIQVVLTLAALVSVALWAGWVWINWLAAEITLTDQRVIQEEGVLVRSSQVIPLDRVQDVTTVQSLIGRLLDYGTVEVDTAGRVTNEVLTYVPGPQMLRDQIFVLSTRLRRGG